MYEFVKTSTGWRIFWGFDPFAGVPAKSQTVAAVQERDLDLLIASGEGRTAGAETEEIPTGWTC